MSLKLKLASGLLGAVAIILVALTLGSRVFVSNEGDRANPPLAGWMMNFTPAAVVAPAPQFRIQDRDLKMLGLDDFRGRLVLVNFWATWCGPCVREMPTLLRLQQKLGGKDFQVVALSVNRAGWKVIPPFFKKYNLAGLPSYHDPAGKAAGALGIKGLPTTILFDRTGRELGRLTGIAEWDSKEVVALMRFYMR
jgi:thiol-disulfide isomerase/thioredoxin